MWKRQSTFKKKENGHLVQDCRDSYRDVYERNNLKYCIQNVGLIYVIINAISIDPRLDSALKNSEWVNDSRKSDGGTQNGMHENKSDKTMHDEKNN